MNYTNSNDYKYISSVIDQKTKLVIGTIYKTNSGAIIQVDNNGLVVDYPADFNNGVIKCENGKLFVKDNGNWVLCNKEDAISAINAEMGFAPNSTQQIPKKPTQLGE